MGTNETKLVDGVSAPKLTAAQRIVRFGGGAADRGQRLSIKLLGVEVLVRPFFSSQQDVADTIAQMIVALGPAEAPTTEAKAGPAAEAKLEPEWRARPVFTIGERVWCNVHGSEGECTVVAVGEGRHSQQIKISGYRAWCPAVNFTHLAGRAALEGAK